MVGLGGNFKDFFVHLNGNYLSGKAMMAQWMHTIEVSKVTAYMQCNNYVLQSTLHNRASPITSIRPWYSKIAFLMNEYNFVLAQEITN